MPSETSGGAKNGDASTNTTEETTEATELASPDTVIEIGGEGATSSESTEAN
ncbi:hypothetical protein [Streptacidiphilus melanogenes]|uniref:hypothetical protein n=1 Tax=Streptacidiphilus melanogenes TaxID=411235 RepID=UPI000AFFE913|nr:hypothetical protein [Streptacidiphilus melanogenes]